MLGALSLFGFVFLGTVTDIVRPAATSINGGADAYSLLRWPGLTTAFLVSFAIVVGGASFGAWLALRHGVAPAPRGAVAVDAAIDGVLVAARWTTGRVQHGSLPVYLVAMAATAGLATIPFAFTIDTDELTAWDNPVQAMLAVLVVAAALTTSVLGSRLGAALGLGVVGLGVAGLFVVHGAPDLALTQLLVETVVVVGFVIGLGHLARQFPRTGQRRGVRITVAVIVGGGITIGLLAAASDRVAAPPVEAIVAEAVDEGGGNNVVNVILTDIRALDTLGEIVVLAVVAVGVLALARPKGAILTRSTDADATEGAA